MNEITMNLVKVAGREGMDRKAGEIGQKAILPGKGVEEEEEKRREAKSWRPKRKWNWTENSSCQPTTRYDVLSIN